MSAKIAPMRWGRTPWRLIWGANPGSRGWSTKFGIAAFTHLLARGRTNYGANRRDAAASRPSALAGQVRFVSVRFPLSFRRNAGRAPNRFGARARNVCRTDTREAKRHAAHAFVIVAPPVKFRRVGGVRAGPNACAERVSLLVIDPPLTGRLGRRANAVGVRCGDGCGGGGRGGGASVGVGASQSRLLHVNRGRVLRTFGSVARCVSRPANGYRYPVDRLMYSCLGVKRFFRSPLGHRRSPIHHEHLP